MTATGALVALASGILSVATLTTYAWWTLRREVHGQEIHAHADGTVHSHFRGSRPHEHPTFVDRYDARLTAWFGPAPAPRSVELAGHSQRRTRRQ